MIQSNLHNRVRPNLLYSNKIGNLLFKKMTQPKAPSAVIPTNQHEIYKKNIFDYFFFHTIIKFNVFYLFFYFNFFINIYIYIYIYKYKYKYILN
jgi:hypothetical protein